VTTNDVQVGVLATQHLIDLGHRRIGHLRGTNVSTSVQRLEGYRQALKKAGITVSRHLIRDCGFTESEGYKGMKDWIASGNLPTAIFAANDPAAIGAMAAMTDAGLKVPDDVALVGAGSIHYGDMLRVPLTTVGWSTSAMGQAAAELLLELVRDKNSRKPRRVVIPPKLVVRESSGS
jgi:LacI family transcriptional regulator, galactose operon repressor